MKPGKPVKLAAREWEALLESAHVAALEWERVQLKAPSDGSSFLAEWRSRPRTACIREYIEQEMRVCELLHVLRAPDADLMAPPPWIEQALRELLCEALHPDSTRAG